MEVNDLKRTVEDALPPLSTRKEVAAFIRGHVDTVSDLVERGELEAYQRSRKRGSPILIRRESVIAYLARCAR